MKRILNNLWPVCLSISFAIFSNCCNNGNTEQILPALITVPASDVTATSALLGGQIAYDGGAEIIERGICCGDRPNPDISDLTKNSGQGTGNFTCSLTGLTPGTLYYARAYATNSAGTAYGGEVRFTTSPAKAPAVITLSSFTVSYYSANVGGRVTDNGGAPIIEKGICWATGENPTIIKDNKSSSGRYGDIDRYSAYMCSIDPLQPETEYNARAYAFNIVDTSYGDNISITTLAVPEVNTVAATDIAGSSATVGGNVLSVGDAFEIESGICYGTLEDPTFYDKHIMSGMTGTGEFKCSLINLNPGTLYHARAYVGWGVGEYGPAWIIYGNDITFTTKGL